MARPTFSRPELPDVLDRPVDPDAPLALGAQLTVLKSFGRVLAHREGVWDEMSPKAVHQFRVGVRRTRSALRTFAACWPKGRAKRLGRPLARAAGALGAVRDMDVLLEFLRERGAEADPPLAEAMGSLARWAAARREEQRDSVRAELARLELDAVPAGLVAYFSRMPYDLWSGEEPTDGAAASAPRLREAMPRTLAPLVSACWKTSAPIADPARIEEAHRFRIAVKRLRYSLEAFAPCLPDAFRETTLDSFRALQDDLGALHDCDVWIDLLRKRLRKSARKLKRKAERTLDHLDHLERLDRLEDVEHDALRAWGRDRSARRTQGLALVLADVMAVRAERHAHMLEHWERLGEGRFTERLGESLVALGDDDGARSGQSRERSGSEEPSPAPSSDPAPSEDPSGSMASSN